MLNMNNMHLFLHKKPILASLSSLIIEEAEIMVALTSIYF